MRTSSIAVLVFVAAGITASLMGKVSAQQAAPVPGTPEYFTQKIEPILDDNCYSCHQESASGGLRLDTYDAILKGGKSGPILVPGDPDGSRMIQAIRRIGKLKMPPKQVLDPADVAALEAWVKAGAKGATATTMTQTAAPVAAPVQPPAPTTATAATPDKSTVLKVAAVTTPHPQGVMSNEDFFENNVRPILANNCFSCHGDSTSGGLKVDSREALLKGGQHGPVLVPGRPDQEPDDHGCTSDHCSQDA